MSKVPSKQQVFVLEYLKDLNATQAAIRAGYCKRNPKNADKVASQLLKNKNIAREIQLEMDERMRRIRLEADGVLRELLLIAKTDLAEAYDDNGNLKPIHDIPRSLRRAISSIKMFEEFEGSGRERTKIGETREIKLWDKLKAIELIGRHLALFTDKVEHTGKDGGPISVQGISDEELENRIQLLLEARTIKGKL